MARHTGQGPTRRGMLRLAGTGLGLAVLGAGAWGCGPEEQPSGAGGGSAPGTDKDGDRDAFTTPPPGTAPRPLWQAAAPAGVTSRLSALTVAGDVVLVSGDPLVGRDVVTGKERWRRAGVTVPGADMLVSGGTLFLASAEYDGDVVGLDPATGRETWRSRLGSDRFAQPRPIAADERHVYVLAGILEKDFSTKTNVIAAIDTGTGKVAWQEQRDLGTEENGITAEVDGPYLIYTDYRKNLTVRDTATGRQRWTKKIGGSNNRRIALHGGLAIVTDGPRLRAFAVADGTERWSLEAEDFWRFRDPAVLDGVLYVSDSGHVLRAVDPGKGRELWRNDKLLDRAVPWQYTKVGTTLYAATELDDKGGVLALDARDGTLRWTYNDNSKAYDKWYVVASGKRLAALHGKRLTALPAV